METPWAYIKTAAEASGREVAVAAFLTTREHHMLEKVHFAHFAQDVLSQRRGGDDNVALVTVSGDTLAEAQGSIGVPADHIQIVVISPHAPDRPKAVDDVRKSWPHAMAAFDESCLASETYILIDLRPCPVRDPGHVHTPVCRKIKLAASASA